MGSDASALPAHLSLNPDLRGEGKNNDNSSIQKCSRPLKLSNKSAPPSGKMKGVWRYASSLQHVVLRRAIRCGIHRSPRAI